MVTLMVPPPARRLRRTDRLPVRPLANYDRPEDIGSASAQEGVGASSSPPVAPESEDAFLRRKQRLSRTDRLPERQLGDYGAPARGVRPLPTQEPAAASSSAPVDPRVARPRPRLTQLFTSKYPAETHVRSTSESTARKYERVMAKLNALPVHESTEEIDDSISTFLKTRFPTHEDGDVILAFSAEMHETVGAMAQGLSTAYYFRDWPNKLYLTEVTGGRADEDDEEATRSALKLLDSMAERPLHPSSKMDEDRFIDRALDGRDTGHRRHLIIDTGAKLTGYEMRGFDPLHGQPENSDARELAQIQSLATKVAANGATVARGGVFHASEWMGVFTPLDGVKAVCIAQVTDPPPDDREAIDRLDELLSNPDVLPVLAADGLEDRRINLMPFISFALSDVDRVHKLIENLASFAPPSHPAPEPGEASGTAGG